MARVTRDDPLRSNAEHPKHASGVVRIPPEGDAIRKTPPSFRRALTIQRFFATNVLFESFRLSHRRGLHVGHPIVPTEFFRERNGVGVGSTDAKAPASLGECRVVWSRPSRLRRR